MATMTAPEPFAPEHSEAIREDTARSRAGTEQSVASESTPARESGVTTTGSLSVFEAEKAHAHRTVEGQTANNLGPAQGIAAAAGAGAGAGEKKKMKKYSHGFWDPEMAMFRKIAFKILVGTVVITTIVMWLCVPVYWGSLWKSNKYTDKLTVRVIDRDGGDVGQTFSDSLLALTNLRYFSTDSSEFPTLADVEHDIVQEGAWAAIVINSGVTDGLAAARVAGDASWDGSAAIDVVYAQARQETAVGNYLLPYMETALGKLTAEYNAQSAAEYFSANADNSTAITLLAQAPGTISNAVYFTTYNIRPYNQPVAQAITLVGLIYMLIFAFIMTMTNNAVREIIAPFLTTKSYIMYRLITPLCLYFVISFFFVMVNLPFKIKFDAHFTYAGGFFLWWFALFMGMASLGLATEAAITVLGPRFMTFFLIPLIISNVSVASLPHELQPWIFRYGVAMPFYNCGRIVRTIIFNTKNDIGKNLGILLGWTALSLITTSLGTWLFRRNSVNQHNKEVGENEMDVAQP